MENLKNKEKEIEEKILANALFSRWISIYYELEEFQKKEYFIELIKKRLKNLVKDKKELALFLSYKAKEILSLKNSKETAEGRIRSLANFSSQEILKIYTLKDLREKFLQFNLSNGYFKLNEIFTYGIEEENISVHLSTPLMEDPLDIKRAFIDAMNELKKVISEQKINKNKITLTSFLVFKNKNLFEKYGFIIVEIDEKTKKAKAEMQIGEFLKKNFSDIIR